MTREQLSTITAAAHQPDETEVIYSAQTQGPALAWSQAVTDEVVPYVKSGSRSRWALLAAALLILAVAATFMLLHKPTPATAPTPAPPAPSAVAPPPPPGPIDGSYRVDHYRGQAVIRTPSGSVSTVGAAYSTVDTEWWAFKSTCTPHGCTAAGTLLDSDTHRHAARVTPDMPAAEMQQGLRLLDGQWRSASPNRVSQPCAAGTTGSDTWAWSIELTQLPDGTLKGQETDVVESNGCSSVGNVITTPVVATRIGEIPSDLPPNTK